MARVEVVVECAVERTFRVEQCAGLFDVALAEKSVERFSAEVPGVPGVPGVPRVPRVPVAQRGSGVVGSLALTRPEYRPPSPGGRGEGDWKIGAIVGPSGSGKSTLARAAFGEAVYVAGEWPRDRSILDGFPAELGIRQITAMLGAVGFGTPPAWVRPHHVLSNGERFRCELARALLLDRPVVVFDEFTSVVDRTVARVVSACVSKAMRRGLARCGRFVAVTCHDDVLDWLGADWAVELGPGSEGIGNCELGIENLKRPMGGVPAECRARGLLQSRHGASASLGWPSPSPGRTPVQTGPRWSGASPSPGRSTGHPLPGGEGRRPRIRIAVGRARRELWGGFARHHYLSGGLQPQARCYAAWWGAVPVAFCATLQNFGYRGQRRVHRVVVLPDYQGLGVGTRLLRAVAREELKEGCGRFSVRTSHPGLIRALTRRAEWRAVDIKRVGMMQTRVRGSVGRCTVGFVFCGREAAKRASSCGG